MSIDTTIPESLELLLVICPPWDINRPPIGLGYLTTHMRTLGFAVSAWDLNIELYHAVAAQDPGAFGYLWNADSFQHLESKQVSDRFRQEAGPALEAVINQIIDAAPKVVGFSVHCRNIWVTEHLVCVLRQREDCPLIIYGGSEVLVAHTIGELQKFGADAAVIGEGERTLAEAMEVFREEGTLRPVPGMVLIDGQEVSELVPRPLIRDLDSVPFPTFEEFDLRQYILEDGQSQNLPILFSRGCIGRCSFCIDHKISGHYRTHSPEHTVAELRYHIEHNGISHFWFNDLLCNGHPGAIERLCNQLIAEELGQVWWSFALVHRGLNARILRKMRASGCAMLIFGLESASDNVLKLMRKTYNQETAELVIQRCHQVGIVTAINVIVGFPGETLEDHRETLDFINRNHEYIDRVTNLSSMMLISATEVDLEREKYGIVEDPEWRSFSAPHGNTAVERHRRLEQTLRLLKKLRIPVTIVNREMGVAQRMAERGIDLHVPGYSEDEDFLPAVEFTSVGLLGSGGAVREDFALGDLLNLELRIRVNRALKPSLLRVQIFNDQDPQGRNIFIFGTNTKRWGRELGPLEPGEYQTYLRIARLGLQSGTYPMMVGLWPDEEGASPYAVRHGRDAILIRDDNQPTSGLAVVETEWLPILERGAGAKEDAATAAKGVITILDDQGRQQESFVTGETVRARLAIPGDLPPEILQRAVLAQGGAIVHQVGSKLQPVLGQRGVEIVYKGVPLLEGRYEVRLSLHRPGSDEPIVQGKESFSVSSRLEQGAGLIYLPASWDELLPFESSG